MLALPILVAASALPCTDGNECMMGSTQCCDSTINVSVLLVKLIQIHFHKLLLTVCCSLITIISASGTSCSQQPVCCTNNAF
ncbi:hydrophobin, partial [Gymnopilus junonius]